MDDGRSSGPAPTIDPTLAPVLARTGSERAVLEAFLDFHRGVVLRKVRDVPVEDARRRLVPSLTTLAGLLTHLSLVERNWFVGLLGQRAEAIASPGDAAPSFVVDPGETMAELVARYERACDESRRMAAGYDLDHVVPHPELGEVSLRWIYVHMIEETARHAGHADILRELTDGAVGALG